MKRKSMFPAYTISENGKTIAQFNGYDELYTYAKSIESKALLGFIMGCATFIMISGECPIKLERYFEDGQEHFRMFSLGWTEVKIV